MQEAAGLLGRCSRDILEARDREEEGVYHVTLRDTTPKDREREGG